MPPSVWNFTANPRRFLAVSGVPILRTPGRLSERPASVFPLLKKAGPRIRAHGTKRLKMPECSIPFWKNCLFLSLFCRICHSFIFSSFKIYLSYPMPSGRKKTCYSFSSKVISPLSQVIFRDFPRPFSIFSFCSHSFATS